MQENANRAKIIEYETAKHREASEIAGNKAREDINKQPPTKGEFNRDVESLAKKFGTSQHNLLNGVSYDDMLEQPDLIKAVHDLNKRYLENPENSQMLFDKFTQDRDRLLGGIKTSGMNSDNVSPNNSSEQLEAA